MNPPSDDLAAAAAERLRQVRLLAVSKTFDADAVSAMAACGQAEFAENYVQEGVGKIAALRPRWPSLCWHFIGPLQSNKTREVARHFDWVHSVDRLSVAQRLSAQRPVECDGKLLPPLQLCLQVNISGESSKSGVPVPQARQLAHDIARLPGLRLRGLMCIPAPAQGLAAQREPFARLRELQQDLVESGLALDTLSMGMSADLEAAVLEGATIVRLGSALFGARAARAQPRP